MANKQKGLIESEDLLIVSGEGNRGWLQYSDAPNILYHHLNSQAFQYLKKRNEKIATLKTVEQWHKRQEEVHRTLLKIVGPFPKKTPLNAKIMEIVKKEGYRIEKLIYESMPNFYVTACLFIPNNLKGKAPAILNPIGHTDIAFRHSHYQVVILNLVKKGFIVLAYDPIGQGERLQYFDPEIGKSRIGGPCEEHSYPGCQCFISGSSMARYFTWDGIRGIDYLLTREEVDPERIGVTGLSGGGTLTSYISAFDDRVLAAAPAGYITSLQRLLESIGPQDAEQNFYHGIANGLDHADLLEVRAPKPALIIATTRDFFSIQGTRETFKEVKGVYKIFEKEENLSMTEDDYTHGYTRKNREALYSFFQKFLNLSGDPNDEKVELISPEELRITRTGQVSTSLGGETIFSINKAKTQGLFNKIEKSRQNFQQHLQLVKSSAIKLSGYIPPNKAPQVIFRGRLHQQGYSIEKYMIQGEGKYVIPVLLMIPDKGEKHPVLLYLHPEGKAAGALPGGEVEWFVKKGFIVLAPDLIRTGEMGPKKFNVWQSSPYPNFFHTILIARSIVGICVGDIVRCVKYLKTRNDIEIDKISAIARGEICPVLLHAAAFEDSIKKVALIEPLISYRSIVMNRYYQVNLILASVPGALKAYDLPDLAACLAPRKLLMLNIVDQMGNRATSELINQDLAIVRKSYSLAKAEDNLEIRSWKEWQSIDEAFSSWLKK